MAEQYKKVSVDQLTAQIKVSDRIYFYTNLFGFLKISKRMALISLYDSTNKPIEIKITNIVNIRKLYIKQ